MPNYLTFRANIIGKSLRLGEMSLRSELSKIIRGYKLICEIDKFYLILQVINAFTDSLFPFVYLYMSSKIITELSTYRRARELIIYALVTVSINFVLSVFSQCINTIKSKHSELFTCRTALFYSDINNKMRYERISNARV